MFPFANFFSWRKSKKRGVRFSPSNFLRIKFLFQHRGYKFYGNENVLEVRGNNSNCGLRKTKPYGVKMSEWMKKAKIEDIMVDQIKVHDFK